MSRWIVVLAVLAACDSGSKSSGSATGQTAPGGGGATKDDSLKGKIVEVGKKVDKGLDKLDTDEVSGHLAAAKQAVAGGTEPHEACSFAGRATPTDATKASLDELKKVCELDVPLGRATRAVVAAEKAKAEQPQAPSLTECSSDDWSAMKTKIEGSPHAGDARWTDLKARWTKVCPGS